jgi:cytochrome c biogenesis protein
MTADSSQTPLSGWQAFRRAFRRDVLPILADLRLAIVLLLTIAVASMSGTVIEQDRSLEFYQANYPEDPALFGFLTWKVLLAIGLDSVYKTWWFLALLVAFGTTLAACTVARQIPALKAAQTWKFYDQPRQFQKLALSSELPISATIPSETEPTPPLNQLETLLGDRGYKVFREGDRLYARKGLIGRIGPIIVHASMLLVLLGAITGSLTGVVAQQMIADGETVPVENFIDIGVLSRPDRFRGWSIHVNRFWIDYLPNGAIDQFYSDLSILDGDGNEQDRKTIFVNEPLRYNGVVLYQTDWSISGIRVQLNNSPIFRLPMAPLESKDRLWGTWVPTKPDMSEGVSLIAKDLQGTVFIYDSEGKPIATVRSGSELERNGVTLKLKGIIGSTGLQIKSDPGIPLVYAGFGLLMLSTLMSYASHSQVWALLQAGKLYVGGRTNRAQVSFERETIEMLDRLSSKTSATELT